VGIVELHVSQSIVMITPLKQNKYHTS